MFGKQEIIKKFCALSTNVGENVFKNNLAHDCFCGKNIISHYDFKFEEEIIEYIENAVKEKMERDGFKYDENI